MSFLNTTLYSSAFNPNDPTASAVPQPPPTTRCIPPQPHLNPLLGRLHRRSPAQTVRSAKRCFDRSIVNQPSLNNQNAWANTLRHTNTIAAKCGLHSNPSHGSHNSTVESISPCTEQLLSYFHNTGQCTLFLPRFLAKEWWEIVVKKSRRSTLQPVGSAVTGCRTVSAFHFHAAQAWKVVPTNQPSLVTSCQRLHCSTGH